MTVVGERFAAARFPNMWQWTFGVKENLADELSRLGLISKAEDGTSYRLTEVGWNSVLEDRGLVVVFCPKCSTDEYLPKGESRAHALCHVCGVGWYEDTTVDPFVPTY